MDMQVIFVMLDDVFVQFSEKAPISLQHFKQDICPQRQRSSHSHAGSFKDLRQPNRMTMKVSFKVEISSMLNMYYTTSSNMACTSVPQLTLDPAH